MADDDLVVHIAGDTEWAVCQVCDQPIDLPGMCPRCARELNEQLEEMRRW